MGFYSVHGLTRSYFTRKVTGYLDYTDRPWRLEPGAMFHPAASAAGWNGGIPVVQTPDGVPMWDSTSIIEHLDASAVRSVLPEDPALRFLAYMLDDFSDEWFYRPAVASRWCYPVNVAASGWQLAQEMSMTMPAPATMIFQMVTQVMTASVPKLGISPGNIETWMNEVYVPWLQVLSAHLDGGVYLLGDRPCIADFALFGANIAHFVADPYCRELADEHGPNVVSHTTRLLLPQLQQFGDWADEHALPETLISVLAEEGRHYLPWVARATVDGSASVEFADGVVEEISTTNFLNEARGILLARYVAARTDKLDAILDRAGVLRYFAGYTDQATAIPDSSSPPQPTDNRPYATN